MLQPQTFSLMTFRLFSWTAVVGRCLGPSESVTARTRRRVEGSIGHGRRTAPRSKVDRCGREPESDARFGLGCWCCCNPSCNPSQPHRPCPQLPRNIPTPARRTISMTR
ncbi:hypothetical protein C8Q70DRAFT_1002314 [Cubamyces menziesii]|nr:hypothetical protein C8Q70DRAFT_1002314 [Cubamyces menziesii]